MKPTGPRTPQGKRRSAQNARRHGLLARHIVIEGEDKARFHALLKGYEDEYQPATQVERDLVEIMAVSRWRQMRIWCMETAGLSHDIVRQLADPALDHATRAALAFRQSADAGRALDLQNRYDARLGRQFDRALKFLEARKQQRKLPNEPPQP